MKAHNKRQKMLEAHGPLTAKAYDTWVGMRRRCNTAWPKNGPNAVYNGMICEFSTFESFMIEVGIPKDNRLSIDRIDGAQGYLRGNVRWATVTEQRRNQRTIKLTKEIADQIRAEYAMGNVTQQALADKHGVNQVMISTIIRNKTWNLGEHGHDFYDPD